MCELESVCELLSALSGLVYNCKRGEKAIHLFFTLISGPANTVSTCSAR